VPDLVPDGLPGFVQGSAMGAGRHPVHRGQQVSHPVQTQVHLLQQAQQALPRWEPQVQSASPLGSQVSQKPVQAPPVEPQVVRPPTQYQVTMQRALGRAQQLAQVLQSPQPALALQRLQPALAVSRRLLLRRLSLRGLIPPRLRPQLHP
jgi:hypothetical protein